MDQNINTSALLASTSEARNPRSGRKGWAAVGMVAAYVFGSVAWFIVSYLVPVLLAQTGIDVAGWLGNVLFVGGIVVAVVIRTVVRESRNRVSPDHASRQKQFIADNGMIYTERIDASGYDGMIFSYGHEPATVSVYRSAPTAQLPYEVGYYSARRPEAQYERSNPNYGRLGWTYIVIAVDRQLPHMVLDSRGNDTTLESSLPQIFNRSQVLSLEGDFDRYFTLYAPSEYERDALYVFTPDLMALLIDNAALFDVETVGNHIYFYAKEWLPLTDAATWLKISELLTRVGAKFATQTARYADERAGAPAANSVALAGKVLKKGRRVKFNLILGAVFVTVMLAIFIPFFSLLFS